MIPAYRGLSIASDPPPSRHKSGFIHADFAAIIRNPHTIYVIQHSLPRRNCRAQPLLASSVVLEAEIILQVEAEHGDVS